MSAFRFDDGLELVPVVHGSATYMQALVSYLLEQRCDALAVPLPPSFAEAVLRGVERLPVVSLVVQESEGDESSLEDDELGEEGLDQEGSETAEALEGDASWGGEDGSSDDWEDEEEDPEEAYEVPEEVSPERFFATYVPIDPCQAVVGAIRFAWGERLPIEWIDPETSRFEWDAMLVPDAYALEHTTLERFCCAMIPAIPPPMLSWQLARITAIAKRILQIRRKYRRVVCLCHLQEWPWLRSELRLLEGLRSSNESDVPSSEGPLGTGEQVSEGRDDALLASGGGADREMPAAENYSLDPRTHLFVHGELPFITGLVERERENLEPRGRLAVEGLKELFLAARSSYRLDLGNRARQITPQLIAQCLKYIRNQTLLERRMTPSFYTIVRSAQQMMGDAFAIHLVSSAKDYAWDDDSEWPMVKMGIESGMLPGLGKVSMSSRLPGSPMDWKPLELNRPPENRDKRQWSSRWNPYQQCSWPDEDQRIESFRNRILERARGMLGADLARTEKFTTSMMDGLDLRETLRHWYDGSLYVKIAPPSIGQLDATVMLFDGDPDPREYSWRATWFAEHLEESTLAFYATPFSKEMLGPGVALSTYGGAMFLFPPRPIEDIWSDPRLDYADTMEQRLVAAACMHAQSRHVAILSHASPGIVLKKIAKRYSRRLVHVPLAHFADSVVQQLRMFHVLNGKHVRSYAAHFIRKA